MLLGVSEKHLSYDLTKTSYRFWLLDMKESFISTNGDAYSIPSTVASGLWWLGTGVLPFFWYLVPAFSAGQLKCCISVANRLAEESPTFNFLLFSCTELYCLSFRSGSLSYASWTQFYNPKRKMHVLFRLSLLLDNNSWQWWAWVSTATSASGLWAEALCYSVSSSACANEKKQFHKQWDYSVLIQVFLMSLLTLRSNCVIFPTL